MTAIYLLRHGEADYEPVRERQWPGSMADLAPLSARGVQQAHAAAERLAEVGAGLLVSSPLTRAIQTASIVSGRLSLPIEVEFRLHEWLPDDTFSWHTHAEVLDYVDDFDSWGGEWPVGERRPWEPLSAVRRRSSAALRAASVRAPAGTAVIAVCHEMVIRSLTGERKTGTGEFRRIESTQLDWAPD
jgi:broad specificity phosphatase PhoE